MSSVVDTGSYAVFQYSSQLNGTQVDLLFAGKIPTSTSSTGSWSRLFTSADDAASIVATGAQIDLKTQEEGVLSTVLTEADKWVINIPSADVQINTFKKLFQLAPTYFSSSGSGFPLNANLTGTDLLDNGLPIMIVHKSYQNGSTNTSVDVPVTSDPNTFVFCKAGVGERNITVNYDPKAQQVFNAALTAVNCTGATLSNVLGWFGAITASSSS